MLKRVSTCVVLLGAVACGGNSNTAPTPTQANIGDICLQDKHSAVGFVLIVQPAGQVQRLVRPPIWSAAQRSHDDLIQLSKCFSIATGSQENSWLKELTSAGRSLRATIIVVRSMVGPCWAGFGYRQVW